MLFCTLWQMWCNSCDETHRVRVANELGAGNWKGAKFATKVSVVESTVIGVFFCVLIMALHDKIAYIFTSSSAVLEAVDEMAYLLAVTILLNSVQPVLSGLFFMLFICNTFTNHLLCRYSNKNLIHQFKCVSLLLEKWLYTFHILAMNLNNNFVLGGCIIYWLYFSLGFHGFTIYRSSCGLGMASLGGIYKSFLLLHSWAPTWVFNGMGLQLEYWGKFCSYISLPASTLFCYVYVTSFCLFLLVFLFFSSCDLSCDLLCDKIRNEEVLVLYSTKNPLIVPILSSYC